MLHLHHHMRALVVVAVAAVCFSKLVSAQGVVFDDSASSDVDRDRRQVGASQGECPSCVLLRECPAMLRLLASRVRSNILTVQRAICGYEGIRSLVCCPVTVPPSTPRPPRVQSRPLLPTSCGFSSGFNRIFGGGEASIGEFPWVAAFGYLSTGVTTLQFHCSGSLINERYILTAAHCLDPATLRGRRVAEIRLGDWDLAQDEDCQINQGGMVCAPPALRVFMEEVIIHPNYARRFQYSDDIALVRLSEPLNLTQVEPAIHPVCLPPLVGPGRAAVVAVGEELLAVGWGMTELSRLSDRLQELLLPVVEPQLCSNVYGRAFQDKQICAGGVTGEDTCAGDSGGPLMKAGPNGPPYVQVGIVSFGLAVCGTSNTPAVYTSVADYRDWIVDNLRP